MPVGELVESGERPLVWCFDERLRLVTSRVSGVRSVGNSEAFNVRMASGRTVEVSADQRFRTLDGWSRLDDLAIGSRVAVPRRWSEPKRVKRMVDDHVVLLAHMIGDGSCVRRQPIRYASIDEMNLRAVTNAAKLFGIAAVRDDYPAARVTTLRLPAPYRLARGRRNPIAAWLDGLGLFGLRSYEKFVPADVFASPNDQVALFLRHLWATDGCVIWDKRAGQGRIYYASTSHRLTEDVRNLLLRLGIPSRAYRIPQAGYRDIWHLHVSGVDNQITFLRRVDVHGAKFFAAREVLTQLSDVRSNANVDTVPREVWDRVRQDLSEQKMSHRAFATAMQIKFCGSTMWKHSPSRDRLHRVAAILGDRGLHDLAKNDVLWDKVVEVTSADERDTVAFAVEGSQNVVANGISVSAP